MNRTHVAALILCCLAFLGVSEESSPRRGAFFNPRISNRSIAFNQVVRVTFTTVPVQLPEVDILSTVTSALELPANRQHWRSFHRPTVSVHERLRTVEVSFALQPRETGELPLPDIPVRWLNGDQVAQFGSVTVADEILVGNQSKPLPLELHTVVGLAWDTPFALLKRELGEASMEEFPDENRTVFTPKPGLLVECRGLYMQRVQVTTPGIRLQDARPRFIDRWGNPTEDASDADEPHLVWVLGWLRIIAREGQADGHPSVILELIREDVIERLLDEQLDEHVFKVLDGLGD